MRRQDRGGGTDPGSATVERASPTDRAFLSMDHPRRPGHVSVPQHFGVVLVLDRAGDLDLARIQRLVEDRIRAVPRLRQRLVDVPIGLGGPVWSDDPGFAITTHVREQVLPPGADQQALLDTAVDIVAARLPQNSPLWSVTWLHGDTHGPSALVVTMHHALADGVGGLAVLQALSDPGRPAVPLPFPRPLPSPRALAADAWRRRWRSAAALPTYVRDLRAAIATSGGLRPEPAAPSSLLRPTGPHRSMAVTTLPVAAVAAAVHRHGASTNDLVLVAVGGALGTVLAHRGEIIDPLVVTVPASGRSTRGGSDPLGNVTSLLLVDIPTTGDRLARLTRVSAAIRARKSDATGPPPLAVLGPLFRLLARLGGYDAYMRHQHRTHTLVTHVRGPRDPVTFAGHTVTAAIPLSLGGTTNMTVHFTVLSYAGALTIAAIADSDHFPELDLLEQSLRAEFIALGVQA